MASPKRQSNARAQQRDASGRFAGPVAHRQPGEELEPSRTAAPPPAAAVATVTYRQPGGDAHPSEPPATGDDDAEPAPALPAAPAPSEPVLPAPATGDPVSGESPAPPDGEPPASGDRQRARKLGFLAGATGHLGVQR